VYHHAWLVFEAVIKYTFIYFVESEGYFKTLTAKVVIGGWER
jgi:hypothetical protein